MSYFSLNQQQLEAAHYFDHPCLILAGAGSGKTGVIAYKISVLIEKKGFEPKYIAALTFTNKAAAEMRARVQKQLEGKVLSAPGKEGQKIAFKQLTICTFHALGVYILRQAADLAQLKSQFSIFNADDSFSLIKEHLASTDKRLIRHVQHQISLWKNNLMTPEHALKQAENQAQAQAARVYQHYNHSLRAYQAVDFDDLIMLPTQLFIQNPELCERWQNRLRYLLVDEYQDTNACQYTLLKQLVGTRAAFTVVGDDDQAIYGWRGATLDNLALLQKDFPQLKVIKLEQNYRSTLNILNAANQVIKHNPQLFEKKLWSQHGVGDPVRVVMMQDEEHEAHSVISELSIQRFSRQGHYRDYAILYRSNYQARVLEQVLRRQQIPYTLSGGQSFFERAEIKDLCAYLRLIANPDDDLAFIRAITVPRRGVGDATLTLLGAAAHQAQVSLFGAAQRGLANQQMTLRQIKPLCAFCDFIHLLIQRAVTDSVNQVLDLLMQGIDYENYLYHSYEEPQAQQRWQNVLDFLNWLKQKGTVNDPDEQEWVAIEQRYRIAEENQNKKNLLELIQTLSLMSILEGKEEPNHDAVHLSTLHAAKGLEYPHVFLVGVEEGLLPFQRNQEETFDAQRVEEERRLIYVGITRAQRSLQISWCKKRRRGGQFQEVKPSRFIAEMRAGEKNTPIPAQPISSPKQALEMMKAMLAVDK